MKAFIVVQTPEDEDGTYVAIHKTFASWDAANEYVQNDILPSFYPLMEKREAVDYVKHCYCILEHEVIS